MSPEPELDPPELSLEPELSPLDPVTQLDPELSPLPEPDLSPLPPDVWVEPLPSTNTSLVSDAVTVVPLAVLAVTVTVSATP